MTRWSYGDSWERYPITDGETWLHADSGSQIAVHDLRRPLPAFMAAASMVYCDPPWSKGNMNSFVTKAGMDSYVDSFREFMDALFSRIAEIAPAVCYLEIGAQHRSDFEARMRAGFPAVQIWPITYYRRHRCYLVRGGPAVTDADFTALDDEDTPLAAIRAERSVTGVADLCTGRGLTLLAAHKCGVPFFGTELNRRRLAVAIDRAAQRGVLYEKHSV